MDDISKFIEQTISIPDTIKYINPYDPFFFSDISNKDTDTIILPDFRNNPLSNIISLDDTTFSKYLEILLFLFYNLNNTSKNVNKHKILPICNYNFTNQTNYFIQIDLTTFEIKIPIDFLQEIINCFNNNTRILILPIRLDFLNIKEDYNNYNNYNNHNNFDQKMFSAHSNLIIIDNLWKTIEFFEPHGISLSHYTAEIIDIPKILENFIKSIFLLPNYTFINVSQNCPIGVQSKQGEFNPSAGHCLVWSLYFIMLRILNINYIPKNNKSISQRINEHISSYEPQEADKIIRQFLYYIESLQFQNIPSEPPYITSYNLMDYVENLAPIVNRLKYLIPNSLTFNPNFELIKAEIISYAKLPNFAEIIVTEYSNFIFKLYQESFDSTLRIV